MFFIKNNNKKIFLILGCIVLVIFIICGVLIKRFHFGNNKTCIDPTKAKYIISLSKQRKAKGILLLVDEQGKIYAKKHFPGYGVVSIVKAGDSYNLYSMRQNKHWKLHKKNTDLTSFSLMKKKYAKYDWENMAAWFAKETAGDIIETMNIGGIGDKYLSNIIYTYKGKRRETTIEEQNLATATRFKSRIYVQGYDSERNKYFINAVNCKTGKKVKLGLKNSCAAEGFRLLKLDNRIITYGDNSGDSLKKTNKTAIAIIDACNNRILGEKSLKDKEVLLAFIHKGRIKLVDYDGILHEYDANLNEIANTDISKRKFYINNSSDDYIFEEKSVVEKTHYLYIFRTHSKLDNKLVGYIDKYRKSDLTLVQSIKISLPEEKDWIGESLGFYVNGD